MRKKVLGVAAVALLAASIGVISTSPAEAADGDTPLNVNFDGLTTTSQVAAVGATTDFTKATDLIYGDHYGDNTMYDEGRYIIGANPHDFHTAWVDWPGATDNMLLVNGFTTENQKVLEVSVPGVTCDTPGSNVTYTFSANMANILPLSYSNDGGAKITVLINGVALGSEVVLTNDPANVIEIVGSVPASDPMTVTIVNNSTVLVGNDFAIDDIKLTQNGECEPPCQPTTNGVWHNYKGKFAGPGAPALTDPKWHALPATPGGEHDLAVRGFDLPYNPGADKGKGDWFVWKDLGTTCPTA